MVFMRHIFSVTSWILSHILVFNMPYR